MSKGHLKRIQNKGEGFCVRCTNNFKEHDIVATSTSQRYCYGCATKINLVTGNINKDLNKKDFILEIQEEITHITRSIYVSDRITHVARLMIQLAFKNVHYVSRNKTGIASAAIFLAHEITFKGNSRIEEVLPVSKKILERNLGLLQKSIRQIDLYSMSETIQRVKR